MRPHPCLAFTATLFSSGCYQVTNVDPVGPLCDAAELMAALEEAAPGEEVTVGQCRIEGGPFDVPEGVTLAGAGRGRSVLVGDGSGPVVRLEAGSPAARVLDLSLESEGCVALLATGGGGAAAERLDVSVTRGVGVAAEGLGSLALSEVSLQGPITAEMATEVPQPALPGETATHGLMLLRVTSASLSALTASGFASEGALVVDSGTLWRGGSASDNMGVGLMVVRGSIAAEDVTLSRSFSGTELLPSFGGIFLDGSVSTTGLTTEGGEGLGLYHSGGTFRHEELVARGSHLEGLRAVGCASVELSGRSTDIADNGLAGVHLSSCGDTLLRDVTVTGTVLHPAVVGETGMAEVGDGVHVVRPLGQVELEDCTFEHNGRVQLLLEVLDTDSIDLTVARVVVDGTGAQLGAVLQGVTPPAGWDAEITRRGATGANDAAVDGPLYSLGPAEPTPSGPLASSLEDALGPCIGAGF